MWLVKLWKSFLKHVDIESLRGLEKQRDKLMEEKSTKADLCRVLQVAQGVTKLSMEPGTIDWESTVNYLSNFYINFRP